MSICIIESCENESPEPLFIVMISFFVSVEPVARNHPESPVHPARLRRSGELVSLPTLPEATYGSGQPVLGRHGPRKDGLLPVPAEF